MAIPPKRLKALIEACTPDPNNDKIITTSKKVKEPTAKELSEMADMAYATRIQRLAEQKKVDVIETLEKDLRRCLIGFMPRGKGVSGISGSICHASTNNKQIPRLTDFNAAAKWAGKTNNFQIFQRRLNEAAVAELVADKKKIPGVEYIEVLSLSLEKV